MVLTAWYATSVAFDGGDGKTNYVAELRVLEIKYSVQLVGKVLKLS